MGLEIKLSGTLQRVGFFDKIETLSLCSEREMSANNFILIEEKKGKIIVSERDYDTGGLLEKIGKADTHREALQMATKHIDNSDYGVEYGIHFLEL